MLFHADFATPAADAADIDMPPLMLLFFAAPDISLR